MPDLITRRHLETRTAIADAAVVLFIEHGFDAITMEDVAVAAGVSRRTAYRHFPSKEDLVFEQPRRWLAHFNDEVSVRPRGESLHETCRRGVLAVAVLIDETASSVLPAYSVFRATPSLRGSNGRIADEWYQRYIELLTPRRPPSAARSLQIATVAGALVGVTTMLVAEWAARHPHARMADLTTAVLDQLDPIWPDWLRNR